MRGRRRRRRAVLSDVVPVATWAANANPAGSRPASAIAARIAIALLAEVGDVGVRDRRQHPAVAVAGDERQAASLLAAEPDRRAAGRQRWWQVRRPVERVERIGPRDAGLGGGGVAEQGLDHLEGRLEPIEPLADRRQRDPERHVLTLMPARAEPEDEAAAGHVVEDRRGLGQDRRVAERVRQDAVPTTSCRAPGGRARRPRERLPARAAAIAGGSVRWSFIQPESKTASSPARAQVASRVGQSTSCGEVLKPIETSAAGFRGQWRGQERCHPLAGRDRAFRRRADQRGVLRHHAAGVVRRPAAVQRAPPASDSSAGTSRSSALRSTSITIVVALLDERDRAAERGLRRDVADHQPVGPAGEPAVGDAARRSRRGPRRRVRR